jgi:hypothetical protein
MLGPVTRVVSAGHWPLLFPVLACQGPTEPSVANLAIEPATVTLQLGFTQQFSSIQRDAAGRVVESQPVVWVSSDQSIVSLDADGLSQALAPGSVTVRAVLDELSASATVTVPRLRFTTIAAGTGITCGVTDEELGYCWGENEGGQLGDGTTEWHAVPRPIFEWPPWAGATVPAYPLEGQAGGGKDGRSQFLSSPCPTRIVSRLTSVRGL